MERCHSYSGGSWNSQNKEKSLQVATVKPNQLSKSLSENNLHSDSNQKLVLQRVFSRLKINDLSLLKKDALIGELEKCLEELETEHSQTLQLANVFDKVETERDQLLNELDLAFLDLQEYMHRQKVCEDNMRTIETDRDELIRENDYLKAVLSNREEIQANKLRDDNKKLTEEVKELLKKVNSLTQEMDSLYEERQTLLSSLLSLRSEQVDSVIRSRSSSLGSSHSLDRLNSTSEKYDLEFITSIQEIEEVKKVLIEILTENKELKASFYRLKNEHDQYEKENAEMEAEYNQMKNAYNTKCKEYEKSLEERNEKNLSLSKVNKEKRTLQMQVAALRERNRTSEAKISSLEDEIKKLSEQFKKMKDTSDDLLQKNFDKLQIKNEDVSSKFLNCLAERDMLLETVQKMKEASELTEKRFCNRVNSLEIDNNKLRSNKVVFDKILRKKEDMELELKNRQHELECAYATLKLENSKLSESMKSFEVITRACDLESATYNEINHTETFGDTHREALEDTHKEALEIERLNEENKSLREKCVELNREVTLLKDTIQSYCLDIETSRKNLETLNETCDALLLEKSAVADSLRKIFQNSGECISNNSSIHQINVLNELLNQLNVKNQSLSASCKSFSQQILDLKEQFSKVSEENCYLKQSLNEKSKDLNHQITGLIKEKEDALREFETISQRCVSLENRIKQINAEKCELSNECNTLLNNIETLNGELRSMKENNELLQLKISSLEINSKESEKEEHQKYILLHKEHENLTSLYNRLFEQHSSLAIRLDHVLQENFTLRERHVENINSIQMKEDLEVLMKNFVNSEALVQSMTKELNEFRVCTENKEKDYQVQISNHVLQIDQERKAFKIKYDTLRVECDKLKREREHYVKTVDTLRAENCEINNELKMLRVNPSQDLFYQRVQEDKKMLEELHTTIRQLTVENKALIDRISTSEENTKTTIRSLKARVGTLEHENENLRRNQYSGIDGRRIFELEEEKEEYLQKLKESEALLLDLQKALAQANDIAMQKSLEGTKIRRCFEKKIDKLVHVNADLKRRLFFSTSEKDSASSTFLQPDENENIRTKNKNQDTSLKRKSSLPPFPLKKDFLIIKNERPQLQSTDSPSYEESAVYNLSNLEQDLADQLKQLLDITNDLTRDKSSIQDQTALVPMSDVRNPGSPTGTNIMLKEEKQQMKYECWI